MPPDRYYKVHCYELNVTIKNFLYFFSQVILNNARLKHSKIKNPDIFSEVFTCFMLFLHDYKMFQCRFYGCIHLARWKLTRTLQFVHSVWCIVHRQADFTLSFRHICRMNFEAVFSSIRF